MKKHTYILVSMCFSLAAILTGCSKFTQIDPPKGSLIGATAFNSDSSALAAVLGIFYTMNSTVIGQGYESQYMGLSADELVKFNPSDDITQIQVNQLTSTNSAIAQLWSGPYNVIGRANACIENLAISKKVDAAFKVQLDGEARFLRALSYFFLVNQFGDLPIVINTDWKAAQRLQRSAATEVYRQIKSDLQTAIDELDDHERKVRASRLAAMALLARVYLYTGQADSAFLFADEVIRDPNTNSELPALSDAFLSGSPEAIFQLEPNAMFGYVQEAGSFIPPPFPWASPNYVLAKDLADAFEPGDQRKDGWAKQVDYQGTSYYYPYKYKNAGGPGEYYMLLRLGEQYLIRGEAALSKSSPDLSQAREDLDRVRRRAGLANLPDDLSKDALKAAVLKERRVELFAELGHRWFDLKRTKTLDASLKDLKPKWRSENALYPIPYSELQKNRQLSQNDGY